MGFGKLIAKLGECQAIYRELHEIGLLKKKSIITGNMDELAHYNDQESSLLQAYTQLELERTQWMVALQQERGLPVNPQMRLTELREALTLDEGLELAAAQQRLADAVSALQSISELNQQLIHQSIDYVDYSLEVMVGKSETDYVYSNPNSRPTMNRRSSGLDYRT